MNVRGKSFRRTAPAVIVGALLLVATAGVGLRAQAPAPQALSPQTNAQPAAPVEGMPPYTPSTIDVPQRKAWGDYPYSAYLDAEIADPDVHRVLYEDTHVRLLEVSNPPGMDVHMHGHPYASVFVRDSGGAAPSGTGRGGRGTAAPAANNAAADNVSAAVGGALGDVRLDPDSPYNGQGWTTGPAPAGMQFPTCTNSPPQAPHKPINHGAVPLHFYRVEFTRLDGEDIQTHWKEWYPAMAEPVKPTNDVASPSKGGPALGPNFSAQWPYPIAYDSVQAAPNNYTLLYQDEHLRLLEVTIRPGETTPMHGHPYPSTVTFDSISGDPALVTETRLDSNSPLNGQGAGYGGPPTVFNMKVPTCMNMAPEAPHTIHNGGAVPLHYYRVDFLRIDGSGYATNWRKWYPWMAYMKYMR
jgi:hypothetical protein